MSVTVGDDKAGGPGPREGEMASLGALGIDALREVANIGSGQALTALARLSGGVKLTMAVPVLARSAEVLTHGDLGCADEGVSIRLHVEGASPVTFLALFSSGMARAWAEQLLSASAWPPEHEVELAESALAELGNIVCCAYLCVIAGLVKTPLVPSTPVVQRGEVAKLLARELARNASPVCLATQFCCAAGPALGGAFVLIVSEAGGSRWLERLGIARGA